MSEQTLAEFLEEMREWFLDRAHVRYGPDRPLNRDEHLAKADACRQWAEKAQGCVLVKPEVSEHNQGYLTGKRHFVACYGASGNYFGKTADEALANLRAQKR